MMRTGLVICCKHQDTGAAKINRLVDQKKDILKINKSVSVIFQAKCQTFPGSSFFNVRILWQ